MHTGVGSIHVGAQENSSVSDSTNKSTKERRKLKNTQERFQLLCESLAAGRNGKESSSGNS
jgi:hypothetical protein